MSSRTSRRRRAAAGGVALLAVSAAVVVPASPALAKPRAATITQVIGSLAAPRGITFDGQGSMYIAESGVAGAGPVGMTHTGKVSKYARGHTRPSWSVGFNSLYVTEDPTAPPDVLGPAGISAVGCSKHSEGKHQVCQVQMITSESTPGILAATPGAVNDPQAGHLFRLNAATGAVTDKADVGSQQYAFTAAHPDLFPDDFPDSNPYGVLVTKGEHHTRTFVADAGANTISEVMRNGTTRIIAYIPNESGPPFRDATPTCIARGPDGYLYVGTLNFVANLFVPGTNGNKSNVWRVNPNANYPTAPKLWATGLTTITACTFDRAGNFWATEMFQGGIAAQPPGDIVKIPFAHPAHHTRIGFGRLPVPGGIAQGPDGAMYVTVGSSAPGVSGAVMRVAVHRADDD